MPSAGKRAVTANLLCLCPAQYAILESTQNRYFHTLGQFSFSLINFIVKIGALMRQDIIDRLRVITEEEQEILDGKESVSRERYTSQNDFVIDSSKLLRKGQLIMIRPHTRFVHFPRHRHDYVEMVYMCSGTTTHIINGTNTITLQEGDLLFLNQYATQEILPAGKDDIAVNFIILPEFFDRTLPMMERENVLRDFLVSSLSQNTALMNYLHFQAKEIIPVQNLIENMIWTLLTDKKGTNTLTQLTMGLIFMNLSMFAETINQDGPDQYEQNIVFSVLKYIETHYRDGTLESISAELKQPVYYLSRLLKKHTKKNFKELLQQRKFQQAEWLLSRTSLPVDAVINAVGYDNSSYFYRIFRKKYGISPKEYRNHPYKDREN